jgi:tripartite ATP-independent transporter DctM subunit
MGERLAALVYCLPIGIITLAIWGVIFFGIATPSEAAAMGVAGALVVIAIYRKLSWEIVARSMMATIRVTSMVFLIIMNAAAFGQILAFTGISRKLVGFITEYSLPPLLVMIMMQFMLIVVGTFMDELAMLLVTIPVYMPIVEVLQFDPVWFGLLILLNLEVATISPPYGLALFVMKGVVPDATMVDVWKASLPFMLLGIIAMALVVVFPPLATWLPGLMG